MNKNKLTSTIEAWSTKFEDEYYTLWLVQFEIE